MTKKSDASRGVVLIVAPIGKDAALAAQVLEHAGIAARVCAKLSEVAAQLDETTNAIVVAEEALIASEVSVLLDALEQQPAWSDIPLIILTSGGGSDAVSLRALEIFGPKANITLIERPLRTLTLTSTMRVALRARRRQREVRELIEQRETALTGIGDAFTALDADWRYIYVNERAAEYASMPREEMIGRSIWEIYPEAIGGTFHTSALRARETKQPQIFEKYYERWQCWLETRLYPACEGVVVFRANINQRKRQDEAARETERKLQENETLLRLAIEAADAGTFDFYPRTKELRYSARAREIFGLALSTELNFDSVIAIIHPEDQSRVLDALTAALESPKIRYDVEYRVIGTIDQRERWVAARGRVLFDAEGKAERFIGTILDVTERKSAELLMQRAKDAAEEANRAKDHFLAMLSHELRTPLTPVLMTVAALQRDPSLSDIVRSDLEVIERNIELEALMIDDLLDLTRIAHGKLELHSGAVDIHGLIEHALTICAADLDGKKLRITRKLAASERHTWGDAARLQQVFWNLIKNAIKFTPAAGEITITARNDAAHRIVISVADSGIGIDSELLPRIFNAFEQGGRKITGRYGGLGLGLAISKSVIDLHHGAITVSSDGRGQGATFTITLQAIETSLLDGPVYALDRPIPATGSQRILLVEDHEDTARVLRRMLDDAGYLVALARSVQQARDLSAQQEFDLVISDVGLPDGTGLDLMRGLRETHDLVGIALSGFGTEEDVAASHAAGFAEHLTKPVDWNRLRAEVERLLARPPLAE